MRPAMYGSYHRISIFGPDGTQRDGATRPKMVAGPLCESGDVFTQIDGGEVVPRALPVGEVGDWVVVHDAGAYGVGKWDLASASFEPGAWIRGRIFARRCDLSPDGKYLSYFALKSSNTGFMGMNGVQTYSAISNLPWLFALASWPEVGTWTRGWHFVPPDVAAEIPIARHGDIAPLLRRFGLKATGAAQYATERRRGWTEHADCPPRGIDDWWDEVRAVILEKPRPLGEGNLLLADQGYVHGFAEGRKPHYYLEVGGDREFLTGVQWADWDDSGRLLVATDLGELQMRDGRRCEDICSSHNVATLEPESRQPAPEWARQW